MRRGCQREIPSPGQNQRVVAFGAIDYAGGVHLSHVPQVEKGGRNASEFLTFFEHLRAEVIRRRRLAVLVLDQGSIHKAKKVVRVLRLAVRRWIKIFWLPKYAPRLNEEEHVWKVAKEQGVANVLFKDRNSLRDHVTHLLRSVNSGPAATLKIGLGGHRPSYPIQQYLFMAA